MLKPTARDEAHPVVRWLMTDARKRVEASEFLEAFAHQLRAAGVEVSRITTGVPILHPQIFFLQRPVAARRGHDRAFVPHRAGYSGDIGKQPDWNRLEAAARFA